jgi:hypothetical protein
LAVTALAGAPLSGAGHEPGVVVPLSRPASDDAECVVDPESFD